MCKYEFDTGNGMSMIIWFQRYANMNLILKKMSMVIWSQNCAKMNFIQEMVCQWLFGPKNGQVGT